MKVWHLNILATKADRDQLNLVGWSGEERFTRHADIATSGDNAQAMLAFCKGEYKNVCELRNELNLDDAFRITQNIESSWDPAGIHRSTSVGDIIEKDDEFFMVAGCGFDRLDKISKPAT